MFSLRTVAAAAGLCTSFLGTASAQIDYRNLDLVEGRRVLAALALADAVRPESREAVARLHQLGLPEEGCLNLTQISDEELRAEARHRGYEHHSVRFSQAAQAALRELEGLRRRIDELVKDLQKEGLPRVGNAEPSTGRVQ